MKKNLLIVLSVFTLMCLIGAYGKLTYIPILNPTNDVDLKIEGIMFQTWFAFTFIFSIVLFFFLSSITYAIRLIKNKKVLGK
jgi:heme/copper-type cytochrome/quinol oxidase subunit 2